MSIYTFHEYYVPRMWGGRALHTTYGKTLPAGPVGEAWLISDHPQHSSVVSSGSDAGQSLHDLVTRDPARVLGARAALSGHGRFPLLLKIADAQAKLSIQVHPDNALALELGEDDDGKPEMWHILHADPNAKVYCGLTSDMARNDLESCIDRGDIADNLAAIEVSEGTSLFVPAGTIHAIGEGCLFAEIQQTSDLTYRIDDWNRVDADGNPRELHPEKSKRAIAYPTTHPGPMPSFEYSDGDTTIRVLTACPWFAAEEVILKGAYDSADRGETFQTVLAKSGSVSIESDSELVTLAPGEACLVTGQKNSLSLSGEGSALMYYVPDIESNITRPLANAGYDINDLQPLLS